MGIDAEDIDEHHKITSVKYIKQQTHYVINFSNLYNIK